LAQAILAQDPTRRLLRAASMTSMAPAESWPLGENDVLVRWYINRAVGGALGGLFTVDAGGRGQARPDPQGPGIDAAGANTTYHWLRKANAEEDRSSRRQLAALTTRASDCRGYIVGGSHTVLLKHVSAMLDGTCLVSPSCGLWPPEALLTAPVAATRLRVVRDVVLGAARARARDGARVAVVNAASAYHCGGGFGTGGRHALEEAMCTQSTLYASLERAERICADAGVPAPAWAQPVRRRDGKAWHMHVPDDGVVLSPFVEVFRQGTERGYCFDDATLTLEAVISVAMPNCNPRMSDSPMDAHPDTTGYTEQLERKWRAVLVAATRCVANPIDCLVVPDAGCGVFLNPPAQVGAALGRLLRGEFAGFLAEVVIAFPGGSAGDAFANAVRNALEGHTFEVAGVSAAANRAAKPPPTATAPPPTSTVSAKIGMDSEVVWEFSVRSGFEPFDRECQEMVEAAYRTYKACGEPHVARVPSRGMVILIDFVKMVQQVQGNSRTRNVRRICKDSSS